MFADATWPGLILSSSAIGAIVGGYMTTWIRGRQERDEAMRTRLIEVSDEFVQAFMEALMAYRTRALRDAICGKAVLRQDGELTEEISEILDDVAEKTRSATPVLTRVGLLYGTAGGDTPYEAGLQCIDCLNGSCGLLRGDASAQEAIHWVLADTEADAPMTADPSATWRRVSKLRDEGLPAAEFDPSDDASVALWARALRSAAAHSVREFIDLSTKRIQLDHPGDLKRLRPRAVNRWQATLRQLNSR